MEKNWLIRTKNNHILGPVSKAKVRELLENGSIKGEDEVCSGNGFWFHVKEADMVAKYLTGEQAQPFNPVSEADTVLAGGAGKSSFPKLPAGENAQYPDDITTVGLSLSDLDLEEPSENTENDSQLKKK